MRPLGLDVAFVLIYGQDEHKNYLMVWWQKQFAFYRKIVPGLQMWKMYFQRREGMSVRINDEEG